MTVAEMTTRDRINELADLYDGDIILLEPERYDEAIIGMCEVTGRVVYDSMEVIAILMRDDGMDRDEAEEFFRFNTVGPLAEGYPIFVDRRCAE